MKENENSTVSVLAEPKKAAERKGEKVKEEAKIYIGPRFAGMVSGTVFKNGRPPVLEAAIQSCPVLAELIIPVKDLVQANKELAKPDSALQRFYQMAENHILGKHKKKGE